MPDILTKIETYKREEIAAAKLKHPLASVEALARSAPPPRGFVHAIREKLARGDYALIAEVKKASPSQRCLAASRRTTPVPNIGTGAEPLIETIHPRARSVLIVSEPKL